VQLKTIKRFCMDFHTAQFEPDACELAHASVVGAHALLRERRPDLAPVMATVGASFLKFFGASYAALLEHTQAALGLSFVRMASRHGSWGNDVHTYHNEEHALELLNGRLARTRLQLGWGGLEAEEWLLLALFSNCHDLRQREKLGYQNGIGANERASIAETHRILRASGFNESEHAEFFDTLAWMIAGSTFDARAESVEHGRVHPRIEAGSIAVPVKNSAANSSAAINSGGSLSSTLGRDFIAAHPNYQSVPVLRRRAHLILVSADLDTANVGEPFMALADSAVRLVREREMRSGRDLSQPGSAQHVIEFLTDGQELYFFKLHRFVSDIGRNVFGLGKTLNSHKLKRLTDQIRLRFPSSVLPTTSGDQVIQEFVRCANDLSG